MTDTDRLNAILDAMGYKSTEALTDERFESVVEAARVLARLRIGMMTSHPERSGAIFICGIGGQREEDGLPLQVHICPAYGLSGFATYTKTIPYSEPGY